MSFHGPQLKTWRPIEVLFGTDEYGQEWLRWGERFWTPLEQAGAAVVFGWLVASLSGFIFGLILGWLKWGH